MISSRRCTDLNMIGAKRSVKFKKSKFSSQPVLVIPKNQKSELASDRGHDLFT